VFEKSPLIITNYDPGQFSEAALQLMKDRNLRREYGAASTIFFERFFPWTAIANRLLSAEDARSMFSVVPTSSQ
jgi:glycosyltransferase involved in cell wall biosynthesis